MDGVGHAVAHEYLPARRAMEKSPRKPAGKTAFIVAASWLHEETAYAGKLLLTPRPFPHTLDVIPLPRAPDF